MVVVHYAEFEQMTEHLPTNRVFLIRLSKGSDPAAGVHNGRIEHIRSDIVSRFSSLENMEEFIAEVLGKEDESTDTQTGDEHEN
jgi:hypothetical protein